MSAAEHIRRIEKIERLNGSVNGNPAWRITFDDGTRARTSSDVAVSYEIGNPGLRAGDLVQITFTRAGRIAYMRSAS